MKKCYLNAHFQRYIYIYIPDRANSTQTDLPYTHTYQNVVIDMILLVRREGSYRGHVLIDNISLIIHMDAR